MTIQTCHRWGWLLPGLKQHSMGFPKVPNPSVTNCGNTSCSCTFVNLPKPSKMVEIYDNYVIRLPVTIILKFMWCEMWEFDNIVHTWCINVSTRPLSLWSLVQAQLEARDDEEDDEYSWTRWEVLRRMAWSWMRVGWVEHGYGYQRINYDKPPVLIFKKAVINHDKIVVSYVQKADICGMSGRRRRRHHPAAQEWHYGGDGQMPAPKRHHGSRGDSCTLDVQMFDHRLKRRERQSLPSGNLT